MNEDKPALAPTDDDELVAYLDGELDAASAARVERRLADDPQFRAKLTRLQQAWDLLDTLQRTEADDDFTRSTVEMVALRAEGDVQTGNQATRRSRSLAWIALAAAALIAAFLGYRGFANRLSRPNRELVRDLPVIERIDEYANIESVEFLQQLQKEGLFAAEVSDAP
jgi:anti-sigma factor RsiW